MSEIIAFEIYRVESLTINGENFVVYFTKKKDSAEYKLIALNEDRTTCLQRTYWAETADDFTHKKGGKLEKAVYNILNG